MPERRAPAPLASLRACAGTSFPASWLPQQTGRPGASCCHSSHIVQPAPRSPSLPLDGLGTGRRAGCKLDALFRQWQLLPAAILPRGHLPVTSQTCNPHAMGEQPSSHQERLGPGGSRVCCQNNSSEAQPVPYALQSRTRGRTLLGTGCGPDKWPCLPWKPAFRRTSTCFLQRTALVFPNCSVPLITGSCFFCFPYVRIWGRKEGPGAYSSSWELRKWRFLLSHSVPSRPTSGTPDTQLLGGVGMATSHRAQQEQKAQALSGKGRREYSLPCRAIMKMKTFLAYRNLGDGSHSKIMYMRESGARTEEKLHGYLRQINIFKCFQLWLRISKKKFKQIFKVLSEKYSWPFIYFFWIMILVRDHYIITRKLKFSRAWS